MARYFSQTLRGQGHPPDPQPGPVSGMQVMHQHPAEAIMRAQDKVAPQSRRILWRTGVNGEDAWLVPNTAPGVGSQTHPEQNKPRAITIGKFNVTPGCTLLATCLHLPSGQTSLNTGINNGPGGVQGVVHFVCTFSSLVDADEETYTYVLPLDGSQLANGSENTNAGGMQKSLRLATVDILPPVNFANTAQRRIWSRPHSVEIEIRYVGSPRVVDLTISEVPHRFALEADDPDDEWVQHIFAQSKPDDPGSHTTYPVEEREDTSGDDADQRHGTKQVLRVIEAQRKRLGPCLFHWGAYTEGDDAIGETTLQFITIGAVASARWANFLNTDQFSTTGSPEAFDPSEPAWSMGCGGYVRRWRYNNPQVFPTQNLAVAPVLLRVLADNNAASTSTEVRLHTAIDTATTAAEKHSWISLTIPAATGTDPAWHEAWGYVTVGLNPEQHVVAQLLVRQETSGTNLRIYAVEAFVMEEGDEMPAYVQTLFATGTATGPTATTSPTAILSQSIPANTLSSDGQQLDVEVTGTLLNTSGSTQTWEIAISLGGVELFRDTTGTFASSATVRPYTLRFSIARLTSTTCFLGGTLNWQTATTTPDTGTGFISATSLAAPISSAISSPTVAWGSAQTLAITVTCSSNHASTNFLARSSRIDKRLTG